MSVDTEYLIVSDPEGCGPYVIFKRYQSPLLCKEYTFKAFKNWINVNDKRKIIFCGDYFDHGTVKQIETFIKTVNNLKREYPDRVIVLLGNRDLNKLRLFTENNKFQNRNMSVYREEDKVDFTNDVTYFDFYNKTMAITVGKPKIKDIIKRAQNSFKTIDEDVHEMVQFLKQFWDSDNIKQFFQNSKIIHVENGIFFAHGGINTERFDKELLANTTLKELDRYYQQLLKNGLSYMGIGSPSTVEIGGVNKPSLIQHYDTILQTIQTLNITYTNEQDDIEFQKYFDLSYNLKLLKTLKQINNGDSNNDESRRIAQLIEKYNKKKNNNGINTTSLEGNKKKNHNEACYMLLINMSSSAYNSPVVCAGGITPDCKDNKEMDNELIQFYKTNKINTVVVGHKPVCFQLPLLFYDNKMLKYGDIVESLQNKIKKEHIYTFSTDLTGYRNLYLDKNDSSVIPLGILKKKVSTSIPKLSIQFLKQKKKDNVVIESLNNKKLYIKSDKAPTFTIFDLTNVDLDDLKPIYSSEIKGVKFQPRDQNLLIDLLSTQAGGKKKLFKKKFRSKKAEI